MARPPSLAGSDSTSLIKSPGDGLPVRQGMNLCLNAFSSGSSSS